jgi:putative alpha-1,2-mannosidase
MQILSHLSVITILLTINFIVAIDQPEDFVNLLAGSFTDGSKFSTGNTLPLIGLPFGFNHWSPQTIDEHPVSGSWWFKGSDHVLTWLRCTHQPSPWIGDWGYFAFGPQVGEVNRNPQHFWEPRGAVIKPYLFDATVAPYGMRIELAPTMHAAILRVSFLPDTSGMEKRVCMTGAHWDNYGTQYINGRATQVHIDRMLITNFGLHIHTESQEATAVENHGDMICYRYKNDALTVNVRLATSLISHDQAEVNFKREVPPELSFDDIMKQAKSTWNK